MMRSLFIIACSLSLFCISLRAQTINKLNSDPEPVGGTSPMESAYFNINFSPSQWEKIAGVQLEFLYIIDKEGNAYLAEVNGLKDIVIFDSLLSRSAPKFYPQKTDGVAHDSFYLLKVIFPEYSAANWSSYAEEPSRRKKQPVK